MMCNETPEAGYSMGTHFSNSVTEVVFADSTSGQLPTTHVIFVPGELLFVGQYAAAAYCSKS